MDIEAIAHIYQRLTAEEVVISGLTAISGGCINDAFRVGTDKEPFFLKMNDSSKYPGMMEAEIYGLQLLEQTGAIRVPKVIGLDEAGGKCYLLMEYLPPTPRKSTFWQEFGQSLAQLHRNTNEFFGLDKDNYIGSLAQGNKPTKDWPTFFTQERLEKQLRLAIDNKHLDISHNQLFQKLYNHLPELFPEEQPALLHGDLWSGNFIPAGDGSPCLLDPSVYYGHREMEIAYTQLFGGFDAEFYAAYNDVYPIQPGFIDRKDIYNLYPLLVHLNLFGKSYLYDVLSILKKF